MSDLKRNKNFAAIIVGFFVLLSTYILGDIFYYGNVDGKHDVAKNIGNIDGKEGGNSSSNNVASQQHAMITSEALKELLSSADVNLGAKTVKSKCTACHHAAKGAAHKIGPNLWGVVDRDVASHDNFNYSKAMKAKDGKWTEEELFMYLKSPRSYVSGTRMVFAGIKDEKELASVILYLKSLK